jgi:NADH:ubiquinone oxidoreductase subunit 5 (subunit L)/multisubunit Na+/H+ antiporter MnhA subunit
MNSNAYVVSGIIAIVFLVAKFIELRFANNKSGEEDEASRAQPKPLKLLLRDALLVYVSSLLGFYIIAQFEEHAANGSGSSAKEVAAFTGGPDF